MPLGPLDGMKLPSASRQNGGYQKTSALCPEEHSGRRGGWTKKPRNTQRGTVRITYREVALRVCMPVGRADTSLQRCLNCGARQGKKAARHGAERPSGPRPRSEHRNERPLSAVIASAHWPPSPLPLKLQCNSDRGGVGHLRLGRAHQQSDP